MDFVINTNSEKKQYIERDNFVVADNDEILRLDVGSKPFKEDVSPIFDIYCEFLHLSNLEKEIYYILNYKEDSFKSFNILSEYVAKLFNRNSRSYYVVLTSLLTKGIIRYNDKGVYLSDRYKIENVENVKYVVIKIK